MNIVVTRLAAGTGPLAFEQPAAIGHPTAVSR